MSPITLTTGPEPETTLRPARRRRWARGLLAVVGLTVALTACSPAEWKAYLESHGVNTSGMSQAELDQGAAIATAIVNQVLADLADLHKYDYVLSDAQLARLRQCESNGNYGITSPGGMYRGAYQFSQSTWNAVASRHFPKWVGYDPARAPGIVQDAMARALYLEMGRSPWPVCGARL